MGFKEVDASGCILYVKWTGINGLKVRKQKSELTLELGASAIELLMVTFIDLEKKGNGIGLRMGWN